VNEVALARWGLLRKKKKTKKKKKKKKKEEEEEEEEEEENPLVVDIEPFAKCQTLSERGTASYETAYGAAYCVRTELSSTTCRYLHRIQPSSAT